MLEIKLCLNRAIKINESKILYVTRDWLLKSKEGYLPSIGK
jgi:hypothetical protein